MAEKKMYCPSCGEDVDTFFMLEEGEEARHCFVCGMKISGGAQPARSLRALEFMMVAEDSMVFREVLKDKVLELELAKEVELAADGEEFLELFTRRLSSGKPVSLAVLDIRMPGMNGVNAAMALRAVEKGLGRKKPSPILFFSSVKCDDTLRKVFAQCAPARYINKGNSKSPEELSDRLVDVVSRLLAESSAR